MMGLKPELGQVWTPPELVSKMMDLALWPELDGRRHVLEPSVGEGAIMEVLQASRASGFFARTDTITGLEYDPDRVGPRVLQRDFLGFKGRPGGYTTIIANPPYIRFRDVEQDVQSNAVPDLGTSNLYAHFIWHAMDLLAPGGELVFLTPSAFLTASGCKCLNTRLLDEGSFTDFEFLGCRQFETASPFVSVWRWVKGLNSRRLRNGTEAVGFGGSIHFLHRTKEDDWIPLGSVFEIKVGFVTGNDQVFKGLANEKDQLFVKSGGQTGRVIRTFGRKDRRLERNKELLKTRHGSRPASVWNREHCARPGEPRIYCCARGRRDPFFYSDIELYDATVFALFPKWDRTGESKHRTIKRLKEWVTYLNSIDWKSTSFSNEGRISFIPKALESFPV